MKTPALRYTILLAVTGLFFAGCSDGKIPVDVEKARGNVISVKQGKTYTTSFAEGRTQLIRRLGDSTFLRDTFNLPSSEIFNRHALALLLNQNGAEGVRIYLGRDEKGQVRMILVPVDKDNKNIIGKLITNGTAYIPGLKSANAQDDGEAIENGQRCPTMCDESW